MLKYNIGKAAESLRQKALDEYRQPLNDLALSIVRDFPHIISGVSKRPKLIASSTRNSYGHRLVLYLQAKQECVSACWHIERQVSYRDESGNSRVVTGSHPIRNATNIKTAIELVDKLHWASHLGADKSDATALGVLKKNFLEAVALVDFSQKEIARDPLISYTALMTLYERWQCK